MLLSDLLPLLLSQRQAPPMPLGGPMMQPIAKSPSNATGASIPAVHTPPLSSPSDMMNSLTSMTNSTYENRLRDLQGQTLQQKMKFLSQLPDAMKNVMGLMGGDTGSGTGVLPEAAPAGPAFGSPAPVAPMPSAGVGGGAGRVSLADATAAAIRAGFSPETAPIAAATGMAESSGNLNAANEKGEHSYGYMQINADAHGPQARDTLGNLDKSMQLAYQISHGGTDFSPWTMYRNGQYKQYLGSAPSSAVSMGVGAGSPQLAAVPDFAGRLLGNEGPAYAASAGGDVPAGAPFGSPALATAAPIQLAQNGPLTSLPAQAATAPPGPAFGSPVAQMPAAAQQPGGAGMSPLQRAILQFGVLSRMGGMGDAATPLEQAFYNSPQFKASQAAASMAATKPIELQYAGPMAEASASATARFTDLTKALAARAQFQPGTPEYNAANTAVIKASGVAPFIGGERPGVPGRVYNPATGSYDIAFQNPATDHGQMVDNAGNISTAPGYLPSAVDIGIAHAQGPATFEPQTFHDAFGRPYQGTRAQLPAASTVAQAAPGSPNMAVGGALAAPSQTAATAAPAPAQSQRIEAQGPTFPVNTPTGAKDLSALSINDLFPNGQGIPRQPAPPSGMGYGEPSTAQIDVQKQDVERLSGYNKEASENQKVYQDLAHLSDVLKRGLNTNKLAPLWSDMANIAQGMGLSSVIPKSYDPNDAAIFDKAANDLIFAAVKKLGGQVKVAEIAGYRAANPNLVLPMSANYNILNDILASGKWQDARSRLATDYWTKTNGAPLSAFDAKFNQIAPLVDVTDAYKNEMRKAGAVFPGDNAPPKPEATRQIGGSTYVKINGQWFKQ